MGFGFPLDLIVCLAFIVGLLFAAIDSFLRLMRFFKKETNGDHIRNMTDQELANFLTSEDAEACRHCEFENLLGGCNLDNPCVKELAVAEMHDWLASPYIQESGAGGEGK